MKCCFCGKTVHGLYAHNPEPVYSYTEGNRCCNECNNSWVIACRLNPQLTSIVRSRFDEEKNNKRGKNK